MSTHRKLFGTDGVRGVANVEPITSETALKLGRALAHVFRESTGRHRKILIGKDTRLSGYMLETAIASGICSMGVDVWLVGPLPTPGDRVSDPQHARRRRRSDFSLAQSLSGQRHQVFLARRLQARRRDRARIEDLVFDEAALAQARASAGDIGKARESTTRSAATSYF